MPVRLFDDLLALAAGILGNLSAALAVYGILHTWPSEVVIMTGLLAVLDLAIAAKYFMNRPGRSELNFDPADNEALGAEPIEAPPIPSQAKAAD